MSKSPLASYEDIDLFDLLETLWAEKFVILATAVMPVLISFGLLHNSTPTFKVRAPYLVVVAPIGGEGTIANKIALVTDAEWVSDGGSALLLTTKSLGPVADYQYKLAEVNQSLGTHMLSEAKEVSELIEQRIPSELLSTEAVAAQLLEAKRVIFQLERNDRPLLFGTISTSDSNRYPLLLNVAIALCGALLGSFFVLFKKTLRDRHLATDRIER